MTDLMDHERRLWIESAEAFRELAHDDVVMILPIEGGIMGRDKAIEALDATPHWDDVEFSAVQTTTIADGTTLLSYEAKAEGTERAFRALCSSIWLSGEDGERIVHHQQTPLPAT